ncbi:hypothetical protein tb265_35370 [Gemmatimonadetes bacterium T265]|nr:hypothetical protein tb265_35370 [Gemmatimonadetes bacterium T265]
MPRNPDLGRNAAIGCFMTPLGAASGAMVGVLLSVIAAYFTRAPACAEMPSCGWYVYAGYGALIGGVSLPFLVLRRLFQRPADPARRDEPASAPDANSSF